jgi:AAA domain, putative AbiEii toxin, Type IV TA system
VWFDREGGEDFRFPNANLRDGKKLVELTRPNALLLTVGASFNHRQLNGIHRWFIDNFWLVTPGEDVAKRSAYTRDQLVSGRRGVTYRKRIESLLKVSDLGIIGLNIDKTQPMENQVRLLHRTGGNQPVSLDFLSQESLGTHAWFAFLGPALEVLDRGSVLLTDELDSSLHPLLASEAIRMFQDPEANPHGAQLLFTTHDATLLGTGMVSRPLSREQVRITIKRKTDETELYTLLDAHPRKDENLERGYLRGRYGGVPRVMAGETARKSRSCYRRLGEQEAPQRPERGDDDTSQARTFQGRPGVLHRRQRRSDRARLPRIPRRDVRRGTPVPHPS